jgi:hypothetical protein
VDLAEESVVARAYPLGPGTGQAAVPGKDYSPAIST